MVIAYTATGFGQHFHPWIIKIMDLETVSHFGTHHQRKHHKHISKVGPRRIPPLKVIKMDTWTSRCLLGQGGGC